MIQVRVWSPGNPTRIVETAALLDTGSTRTFCSKQLFDDLGVSPTPHPLRVNTLNHADETIQSAVGALTVCGSGEKRTPYVIKEAFSMPRPHLGEMSVMTRTQADSYAHLRRLPLPERSPLVIHLLLGVDNHALFKPRSLALGSDTDPFAIDTRLGWIVLSSQTSQRSSENWSVVEVNESLQELDRKLARFWTWESTGLFDNTKAMSVIDKGVEALWRREIKREDGHYILPIPFKHTSPHLPDSMEMARKRLEHLHHRLQRDPTLKAQYVETMNSLLENGYAEPAAPQYDGPVWHIPHHPVFGANKDKLRVVFDCAAKSRGVSLNDVVHQGPDYNNSLLGVLLRFRTRAIAFMTDVHAMFHQVRVPVAQRDVLRFLWWPNGDLDQRPATYRMTAHLFGGTWSPAACVFALRQTALDFAHLYGDEAAYTVNKNFYVDDCLKSVDNTQEGKQLIQRLRSLVSEGGFHLSKWTSNDPELLDDIPLPDRSRAQNEAVPGSSLEEHALGVQWSVCSDHLGYAVRVPERPVTKRGLLSTLSSVFDPLGLVSPFVLHARLIVQDLCRAGVGWDDALSPEVTTRWIKWLRALDSLPAVTYERCFRPSWASAGSTHTLHHFSDASQLAYGVASYLVTQEGDRVSATLVMAKSRLAPLKEVTIPRLELMAATLATRQDELLRVELDIPLARSCFWTDSTLVLQYINNEERRFHVFVANRVTEIRSRSDPADWHHVPTKENPADDCSRGLDPEGLLARRWQHGPEFLLLPPGKWPRLEVLGTLPTTDPEVKAADNVMTTEETPRDVWQEFLHHHSDYQQLIRRVALLRAFFRRSPLVVSPSSLRQAEQVILRSVQASVYAKEIALLNRDGELPRDSALLRLSPEFHNGLLVTTGRIRHAPGIDSNQPPIILPARHHVTEILLRQQHQQLGHCGVQQLIAESRKQYWIIGVTVLAKRVARNCFICRRREARPLSQRMADLPPDRVTSGGAAFTNVGLDYFGPILVKRGRGREKRYGCLFTCLVTRAVHIEVAHSLDTDSFLSALYRFIARRGLPDLIRSDNGRNFVGAEKELQALLNLWNQDRIQQGLAQRGIKWLFNPPDASHRGGVWERQIRTVRRVLAGLTREQVLTDEALRTLLTIAEGIINDRPLTPTSDAPEDLQALTPNHLLILRAASLPNRDFGPDVPGVRQRWRQVLYMADLFWTRWKREYLTTLRSRTKWHGEDRNVMVGDIVLLMDKQHEKAQWPLARVMRTFPGSDGLVRTVEVKTAAGRYVRPVQRLCMLEEAAMKDKP